MFMTLAGKRRLVNEVATALLERHLADHQIVNRLSDGQLKSAIEDFLFKAPSSTTEGSAAAVSWEQVFWVGEDRPDNVTKWLNDRCSASGNSGTCRLMRQLLKQSGNTVNSQIRMDLIRGAVERNEELRWINAESLASHVRFDGQRFITTALEAGPSGSALSELDLAKLFEIPADNNHMDDDDDDKGNSVRLLYEDAYDWVYLRCPCERETPCLASPGGCPANTPATVQQQPSRPASPCSP